VSEWHDVGPAVELERAGRLVARVGGREIGVVCADERVYAIRNRCPHHGGPLALGLVRERETGRPGHYGPGGGRVLRCPWHGWEFDLETGTCLEEPGLRAAVYGAKVADGRVFVAA
jgi:nitrite reductase (NADH) small subunit